MIYFLVFIVLFVLELVYIQLATYYNVIDKPNDRSSHSIGTVRGGGIIFWFSFLLFFIFSNLTFPFFFIGLTLISLISFIDDLKTLPNWTRLAFQFITVTLIFYEVEIFTNTSYWLIFPFFILSVGIINAYNFMDGINGMTGSYSSVLILTFWIINTFHKEFIEVEILYYVFISLQVFNLFNFRTKAKCFAGDIGSISMAAIILFLLFKLIKVEGNYIYILLLSVYGIDTIQTIIFRLLKRENIFQAHKMHFFQILVNKKKLSHLYVSALYSFIQLGINLCVILSIVNGINSLVSTSVILVVLNLFYIYVRYRRAT
jgi:UDP-GlcNAc:undecaprenyl-phosphate/decaprenyl-phosphate GlcNAc-1-phosphate transferase